ncbi:hypothetical protein D3H55_10315 [Bacillus salacetis]|uniref:Uncharacterized protein n=1 Tax=Bacillus salacetis TaxID=2315464 RepID=A0A3A1R1W9_9BACI|nr:hypothetical protein D3H55_10315 [Bacillus salacetis]
MLNPESVSLPLLNGSNTPYKRLLSHISLLLENPKGRIFFLYFKFYSLKRKSSSFLSLLTGFLQLFTRILIEIYIK